MQSQVTMPSTRIRALDGINDLVLDNILQEIVKGIRNIRIASLVTHYHSTLPAKVVPIDELYGKIQVNSPGQWLQAPVRCRPSNPELHGDQCD